MSRIGKKPIIIPDGVNVTIEEEKVTVKGPKGELYLDIPSDIKVENTEEGIAVSEKKETKTSKALWGTIRALIFNMVEGVKNGYSKELQIKGVGYRAEMKGEDLVLKVGFSHLVEIRKIEGVEFSVNKDIITVSGIKKQLVNNVAADIRKVRRPDPYKGKGIRYKDEVIVLKEGKKSVK
ncbi:MAG: 50S ribosomal protein L6 [Candidatus Pacebacteria bacterium]|nr:50S ribosomal protein L6 [Candidatus Paceibacterota bacterium]